MSEKIKPQQKKYKTRFLQLLVLKVEGICGGNGYCENLVLINYVNEAAAKTNLSVINDRALSRGDGPLGFVKVQSERIF